MDDKNLHITDLEANSSDFFSKGKIAWPKTDADVWAELEGKIKEKPAGKSVSFVSSTLKLSAAAVILVLVGLSAITILYTKSYESIPGEKIIAQLPDGSTVEMNVGSTLKYHPLKWKFQRKLQFEGEGFFEVSKGKKFEVESANGKTQVLGTSFNIYSRENNYRVTCVTGEVRVVSNANESVLLTPNSHVELVNGKLVMKINYKTEKAIDWKMNRFDFTGRSLKEVFNEISRQYAVDIQLQPELGMRSFSSNFSKPGSVEEVLDYVCKSMQLTYVKQSENVFLVVKNN
jgi:ferric-dicitrate binding protein FerR (iron transport regulator)